MKTKSAVLGLKINCW